MSRIIRCSEDSAIIQENLNRLQKYVKENKLSLNIKKCYVVSFTRRTRNFTNNEYTIEGKTLQREKTIRDLGVTFDTKLTFNKHVDEICRKAKQMLGFILRAGKFFKNATTFKTLYTSLVRSHLEYASTIWCPHTNQQILEIEKIQHRFLRFLSAKFHGRKSDENCDYAETQRKLNLDSLEKRRTLADIKFITKAFNGIIDGRTFIHNMDLATSSRTRNTEVFKIHKSRTDTGKFSVCNRLKSKFNTFCGDRTHLNKQPSNQKIRAMIK
jgi:hypothetical protein